MALLAAVALAAGIGSATAIYTVVNAVMIKPLPYRDGDRFVALFGAAVNDPEHYSDVALKDAQTYQQRTQAFDVFGWFRESSFNLVFAGEPQHVVGVAVTTSLAHHLGVNPVLGQWFHDQTGAVISNSLWRRLGGDPAIVGKGLILDGRGYTVTGVMPETFRLPVAGIVTAGFRSDVWVALDPQGRGEPVQGYFLYARRKPGVPLAAAEADVKRVAAEIAAEDPVNHGSYTARLFDLRETAIKDIRPTLLLIFAAAGLLFLITCANAAGLFLVRSVARARETAVRVALGAGRAQLAAQYFAEGLLVSLAGAAGGILLSILMTPAIVSMAAAYLPRAEEIAVDWRVLLFATGAAIVASALFSLAPLWQAIRTAPADALGEGVRGSAGTHTRRLSQSLVVAEIALAFGLLAVSAVLILHLRSLSRISPGFDTGNLITFKLSAPETIAAQQGTRIPFQLRVIQALRTIPGATEVAFSNQLPLSGCCMGTAIYPEGRPVDRGISQRTSLMGISSGYFRAMKIPLLSGRLLTDHDAGQELTRVVISQAAARRYWGDQNPVGQYGRFLNPAGARFEVVGVAGDVKNDGLGNPPVPDIYILSFILKVNPMHVVVRSERPAAALVPEIRRVIRGVDSVQPIHDVATMGEVVRQSMTLERAGSFLTAFFAGAALLLAMLGVYGIVSYSVRQRTVEIGTRMALGATGRGVLSLVVREALKMTAVGIGIGGLTAVLSGTYLTRLFKIGALGPAPFLYSAGIVTAIGIAASLLPAWRASWLSPMVAIRNEPEGMWQLARRHARRAMRAASKSLAGEVAAVPLGTLISEFADTVRRSSSFPEAIQVALATLRGRTGAQAAFLLENHNGQEYGGPDVSIPGGGFLVNRLRSYSDPLTLTGSDFDAWLRWAREYRPQYTAEIEMLRNTGARLAVALRTKNEMVGVLLLGPPERRDEYSVAEKQVVSSSADVFALMIENARLTDRALEQEKVKRDLALAAEVQKRLLPASPPRDGAVSLAAFSLPARTVGGDYYDFLDLGNQRLALTVADVAGKGIAAALLMSVVQASLRVISAENHSAVSQLTAKMNRYLYRSTPSSKYATFFYAELDDGGRRLRYVNAGHNPPYLARRTGGEVAIQELNAGGLALGLFPEARYQEAAIELSTGDVLVAFTDGVTEALDPGGQEFGEQRVQDILRQSIDLPAAEISARIAADLREWIGDAEQYDDLTYIVMKVNELESL